MAADTGGSVECKIRSRKMATMGIWIGSQLNCRVVHVARLNKSRMDRDSLGIRSNASRKPRLLMPLLDRLDVVAAMVSPSSSPLRLLYLGKSKRMKRRVRVMKKDGKHV